MADRNFIKAVSDSSGASLLTVQSMGSDATHKLPTYSCILAGSSSALTSGKIPVASTSGILADGPSYSDGVLTLTGLNLGNENLSTYHEGTWTPALIGSTGSLGSYAATTTGTYTRIGRLVSVKFAIALSSKGSWTGNASIIGFPYSSSSTSGTYSSSVLALHTGITLSTNYYQVSMFLNTNSTSVTLYENGSSYQNVLLSNISNSAEFYGSLIYYV